MHATGQGTDTTCSICVIFYLLKPTHKTELNVVILLTFGTACGNLLLKLGSGFKLAYFMEEEAVVLILIESL